MTRAPLTALALLALLPAASVAQDSYFSLRGLGHPGRPVSTRARATGGAFAPFDPASGTNPAATARISQLTASATTLVTHRKVEGEGIDASMRQTRFPIVSLSGPFFAGNRYAVRIGPYLNRSYLSTSADTVEIRGDSVGVSDEFASDGGSSELGFVLARRLLATLDVGGALHVLVGSSRVRVTRTFDDSAYADYDERAVEDYSGLGVSLGVVYHPNEALGLAGYVRSDGRFTTEVEQVITDQADLPATLGGGILALLSPAIRVGAMAEWRGWSSTSVEANSFDTFEVGLGTELGPGERMLRAGVRFATLPFGPDEQPTEFAVAGGFGFAVASGRGSLDFALERVWRTDGRVDERLWSLSAGLIVRP